MVNPGAVVAIVVAVAAGGVAVWRAVRQSGAARERQTGPGLADVATTSTELTFTPRGGMKVLGLRGILRFPLSSVTACSAWPGARDDLEIDVRWGGTGIPGRLTAGRMLGPEGRSFWLYGSGENAVYIALHDQAFAYVVIEVDDPAAVVTRIDAARRR